MFPAGVDVVDIFEITRWSIHIAGVNSNERLLVLIIAYTKLVKFVVTTGPGRFVRSKNQCMIFSAGEFYCLCVFFPISGGSDSSEGND